MSLKILELEVKFLSFLMRGEFERIIHEHSKSGIQVSGIYLFDWIPDLDHLNLALSQVSVVESRMTLREKKHDRRTIESSNYRR